MFSNLNTVFAMFDFSYKTKCGSKYCLPYEYYLLIHSKHCYYRCDTELKFYFPGLQYVVEVQKDNKSIDGCYYVCALCSKKMSSKTLLAHIKSVPHRLKFIVSLYLRAMFRFLLFVFNLFPVNSCKKSVLFDFF